MGEFILTYVVVGLLILMLIPSQRKHSYIKRKGDQTIELVCGKWILKEKS